jgi:hypothetical protein
MSKKLIAVAAAVALALTGLVAAPAQASSFTVNVDGSTSTGTLATAPAEHAAPEQNSVNWVTTSSVTDTSVRIAITPTAANSYTIVGGSGVKLLTVSTGKKITEGVESVTGTFVVGTDVTVYAYTTSTTAGTVTISSGGNTSVRYVKSAPGTAYNVSAVFPTFLAEGASGDILATLTDVFGNKIIGGGDSANDTKKNTTNSNAFTATGSRLTVDAVGVTVTDGTNWAWDATKAAYKHTVTSAVEGAVAIRLSLETDDYSTVSGFAKPVLSAFSSLNAADPAIQIAALTAQLAESRPKAKSVTKKRFNTLARKWNAAFPSQKVKLKK